MTNHHLRYIILCLKFANSCLAAFSLPRCAVKGLWLEEDDVSKGPPFPELPPFCPLQLKRHSSAVKLVGNHSYMLYLLFLNFLSSIKKITLLKPLNFQRLSRSSRARYRIISGAAAFLPSAIEKTFQCSQTCRKSFLYALPTFFLTSYPLLIR